jgi:hypothetical protein
MNTKICKTCKQKKELSEFHGRYTTRKGISKKYGFRTECAECINNNRRLRWRLFIKEHIFIQIKARAKKKNIPFTITLQDIEIPTHCPILEIPLEVGVKKCTNNSPSLDKIIPGLGYIPGNVRVISMLANKMKTDASKEEILKFTKNIEKYLNKMI